MEKNKKLIDYFVETVIEKKDSFLLEYIDPNYSKTKKYYHFIQSNVFNTRYIYGVYSYNESDFYKNINLKYELMAIVKDNKIYIIDEYRLLNSYGNNKEILPKNVIKLSDQLITENENAKNILFNKFYEDLPIKEITDDKFIEELKIESRKVLFNKKSNLFKVTIDDIFDEQDVIDSICEIVSLKEKAESIFSSKKEIYINKKSMIEKIKQLMTYENIAADWELKIADAIKNIEVKTVFVEFEYNNKKESIKINPKKIIEKLAIDDDFSSYDFEVKKHGDFLLEKLGVNTRLYSNKEEKLKCKNINKITFGKKVLYEK